MYIIIGDRGDGGGGGGRVLALGCRKHSGRSLAILSFWWSVGKDEIVTSRACMCCLCSYNCDFTHHTTIVARIYNCVTEPNHYS